MSKLSIFICNNWKRLYDKKVACNSCGLQDPGHQQSYSCGFVVCQAPRPLNIIFFYTDSWRCFLECVAILLSVVISLPDTWHRILLSTQHWKLFSISRLWILNCTTFSWVTYSKNKFFQHLQAEFTQKFADYSHPVQSFKLCNLLNFYLILPYPL